MKRLPKSLPTDEVEINASPLIDMVFILPIFFYCGDLVYQLWKGLTSKYRDTAKTHFPTNLPLLSIALFRSAYAKWIGCRPGGDRPNRAKREGEK